MDEDDEEEEFGGLFENGRWAWDESDQQLIFISEAPPAPVEIKILKKAPTGTVEFRDDIDLIEQMRYRRRYQRKVAIDEPDVVCLQDCKDLALYTAPVNIMSKTLINLLHCPTIERFLRALVLYSQYFLQVDRIMQERMAELSSKVRTPICLVKEAEMRNDLADLRVLVAKEYCTLIVELEVHRLFKSELFNIIEHKLKTNYIKNMPIEESSTLFGFCNKISTKLYQKSPLYNEVFCHDTGFRLTGLGVTGFEERTYRMDYLEAAISAPEHTLADYNITVGILGLQRSRFDTMLNEIKMEGGRSGSSSAGSRSKAAFGSKKSSVKMSKSKTGSKKGIPYSVYPDIFLPGREKETYFPPSYPDLPPKYKVRSCNKVQEKKWIKRFERLTNATARRSASRLKMK